MSDSGTMTGARFSKFEEMSPNSRSFYQRTLGKMEAGALRGAIFTLISTCIGAGCLTLPLVFSHLGIILGTMVLIFACFCSYMGILNIRTAAENFQCYEYAGLVDKVLGKKMKIIFDNAVILYAFGTVIGYQVMVGKLIPSIFTSLNISFEADLERIIIMVAANLILMMPLSLMRTLTSLRFMSILSALTLAYIAILIIAEFPFYAKEHSYDNVAIFTPYLGILPSYNICLYSFTCHTNVAQVYDELNNKNPRRMGKVARRALSGVLLPYLMLSIFGYLSLLDNTPQLIIMRSAPNAISNDWLMVIARVLMTITLIIGVPINLPPCRSSIIKSWLGINARPSNLV